MEKIPVTVEVLDQIPDERLRGLYDQDPETGAFKLYGPVAKALDVSGLTSALDKERKNNKTAEGLIKAFRAAVGAENPEEAQALIEQMKATGGKDISAQLEKMRAEMDANYGKKLSGKDEELKKMYTSLEKHLIEAEATSAISALEGNVKLLLPHVRNSVKVMNEDGHFVARVVDAEGDPRGDGKGGYMTIRDLVAEMRSSEDFSGGFKASSTTGSGTRPSTTPAVKTPAQSREGMSSVAKIEAGLAQMKR